MAPVPACTPRQCRRLANPILATTAAGGLFFDASTKNGIGRGKRCRNDRSRRNHSPLRLRRLESDAEPRSRHGRCRRNRFSLRQRRIESDAERCCCATVAAGAGATPAAFYLGLCRLRGIQSPPAPHDGATGRPFFFAAAKIRIGHGRSLSRRSLQAGHSLPPRRLCCIDSQV